MEPEASKTRSFLGFLPVTHAIRGRSRRFSNRWRLAVPGSTATRRRPRQFPECGSLAPSPGWLFLLPKRWQSLGFYRTRRAPRVSRSPSLVCAINRTTPESQRNGDSDTRGSGPSPRTFLSKKKKLAILLPCLLLRLRKFRTPSNVLCTHPPFFVNGTPRITVGDRGIRRWKGATGGSWISMNQHLVQREPCFSRGGRSSLWSRSRMSHFPSSVML